MPPQNLCARIEALLPDGVEILTHDQFNMIFKAEGPQGAPKGAAAALGERCGASVLFIGTEAIFVRFTRR